jgi:hypothetical protein
MNRSTDSADAEVAIDMAGLGRNDNVRVTTLPANILIVTNRKDGKIALRFKLAPEQSIAIQLQ